MNQEEKNKQFEATFLLIAIAAIAFMFHNHYIIAIIFMLIFAIINLDNMWHMILGLLTVPLVIYLLKFIIYLVFNIKFTWNLSLM